MSFYYAVGSYTYLRNEGREVLGMMFEGGEMREGFFLKFTEEGLPLLL